MVRYRSRSRSPESVSKRHKSYRHDDDRRRDRDRERVSDRDRRSRDERDKDRPPQERTDRDHGRYRDHRRDVRRDDRWDGRRSRGRDSSPRDDRARDRGGRSTSREREKHPSPRERHVESKTRDRTPSRVANGSSPKPAANDEEEKKRQRREKLEAWKKKKAEEEAKSGAVTEIPASKSMTAAAGKTEPSAASMSECKADQITVRASVPLDLSAGPVSLLKIAKKPSSKIFGSDKSLGLDDEKESTRKLELLPPPTSEEIQIDEAMPNNHEHSTSNGIVKHIEEDEDPLDAYMVGMEEAVKAQDEEIATSDTVFQPRVVLGENEDEPSEPSDDEDILEKAAKKAQKKKEVLSVDHSQMKYEPFRKDFYVEPADLTQLTEEEVDNMRMELDGIKVRGLNCPKPVAKWSQCGLPVSILNVIKSMNYEKPTSIQAQSLPAIMSGRDIIGVAKTGSGKTIAFLLPMFRHLKDQKPLQPTDGPIALIMTPTRELATQTFQECKPFLKILGLRAVCAYGGAPIKDQIADFKRGAEIVVCTPGRMIDILAANSGRVTNLRRVTYIVLDEADRMFDLGFEPQVMRIVNNVRPDRQTVLFSATFPKAMEALARKILRKPVEIVVGARSVVAPEIKQIVEVQAEENKFTRLLELLGLLYAEDEDVRALIFVDRQESADNLLRDLMRRGYPCMSIHGAKDQADRDSVIEDFKAGVVPILIATSVAARGLDVKQLKLVVNFDCPNHMEDYVHRVGRTGRAGNTGTAVTFLTPDQERYAVDIAKALKMSLTAVPPEINAMAERFLEKVKSGQEKASGSGFGGKGLDRLDKEREAVLKMQRRAYGEDEDEDGGGEIDDSIFDAAVTKSSKSGGVIEPSGEEEHDATASFMKSVIITKKAKDTSITSKDSRASALEKARAAMANINTRLKGGKTIVEPARPDAGEYQAVIEINDFPRLFPLSYAKLINAEKARWAVTNRTNISKALEYFLNPILICLGTYVPPGKPIPLNESKLYILVEGDTELAVSRAITELKRLMAEGITASAESDSRTSGIPTGRYSVL
ncbi:Pre-mRNA-processing ATP-dependent RNA helicase PRP5 [Neolecta irregularis DAH-3]|uniref:RNA helicase n=1 Tax=Neolecta irregularis (strain DAH-3) TaxID=1198029 RepID=A0A1U7LTA1_NEOID|nr:Pre-mRNA-processing ATP-dependent RNA helicase PRP5 [Neolecta irregularis DAH-3]|eukprot:OLL25813.1 Pre-mRNA-processing ATP-dependent RNA helicase PRP5 [Neolecta irregularis DAH-3]